MWKLKHANSILETFEYFCQISWKLILIIFSYTVSKLVRFFETQCRTKHTVDRMTHCGDNYGHSKFDISRRVHLGPHFEEGEVVGVIDRTIGKSDGGLPYAPHCEYCPISNYSAAICHRMSAALDSTGGGVTLGQNFRVFPLSYPWCWGLQRANTPG